MASWAFGRLLWHRNQIAPSLWVFVQFSHINLRWHNLTCWMKRKLFWHIFLSFNFSRRMPHTYQHQNHECHNKLLADFMFMGSTSLIATGTLFSRFSFVSINPFSHCCYFCRFTAGHSSESKNVAMWDTLLPQKKSMVACKFAISSDTWWRRRVH